MVGGKIRELRMGVPSHKNVTLGDGDFCVDVVVVILSIDMTQRIEEQVQEYCTKNADKVNDTVRSQYFNKLIAFYSTKDPDDPTYKTPAFSSYDEMNELLDVEDVGRINKAYGELLINKSQKIELLTQEQLDTIKKHLEVTQLNDLSTVLLVHLASCHQTIVSEL